MPDAYVWDYQTLDGKLETGMYPADKIQSIISSIKDTNNKVISRNSVEELKQLIGGDSIPEETPKPEVPGQENKPEVVQKPTGANPHILPQEKLSEEQTKIDQDFEQILNNRKQGKINHLMINALAGTGKTTILKHLAWKFGAGQKWLYLVFNTANKVEAKEYVQGYRKFPSFVDVETTNSFLGRLLNKAHESAAVPQTDRLNGIKLKNEITPKKSEALIDSPSFQGKFMRNFPDWDHVKGELPNILNDFGIRGNDNQKFYIGALQGIINQTRSEVQKRILNQKLIQKP